MVWGSDQRNEDLRQPRSRLAHVMKMVEIHVTSLAFWLSEHVRKLEVVISDPLAQLNRSIRSADPAEQGGEP